MAGVDPMVVFGRGQCIECGGQLTLIDMETTFMRLGTSGCPITEDTIIKCEAVCSNCGKRYPMIRNGAGYALDGPLIRFIKQYAKYKYCESVKESMERQKPTKENPFCINLEGQK